MHISYALGFAMVPLALYVPAPRVLVRRAAVLGFVLLGLSVLLAIVPVIMIFGFLSLAAVGTFAVLAVVFVLRRVGEYAFVRPGREILFSRVDNETKYKAKNVVDVPVYRASDAITAQVSTALEGGSLGTSAVALLGAVVAAIWAVNGWWLGKRSEARHA